MKFFLLLVSTAFTVVFLLTNKVKVEETPGKKKGKKERKKEKGRKKTT